MPINHNFKVKNWKLAVLALGFFCLFIYLGLWQLSRAHQKQVMIDRFTQRTKHTPFTGSDLNNLNDWRFYRATLTGRFDNEHTLLLDNKIFHGQIGYEIYTPFQAEGMNTPLLIDRGFIPMGENRTHLPHVQSIAGTVTLTGMLNTPPTYVTLGAINDAKTITWPLRVEYIHIAKISELVSSRLFPYVLIIKPEEWQITTLLPARHQGYAVQWFALALTLLVLFVALNRRK